MLDGQLFTMAVPMAPRQPGRNYCTTSDLHERHLDLFSTRISVTITVKDGEHPVDDVIREEMLYVLEEHVLGTRLRERVKYSAR